MTEEKNVSVNNPISRMSNKNVKVNLLNKIYWKRMFRIMSHLQNKSK